MPKTPQCDHCMFYFHNYHIVCAIHPTGLEGSNCLDFRPNPELEGKNFMDFLGLGEQRDDGSYSNPYDLDPQEELWEPEGASYYNGELILQPSSAGRERSRWSY